MNRRELYAMGEPLGECVTRPKLGGGYVCGGGGGGGSSSSDTSTKTTTYNTDKRIVADGNSNVTSADIGSGSTVNVLDGGAIKGAGQVATTAITTNATNVDHLLATADHLFSMQANSVQASLDLTKSLNSSVQQAYADASAQAAGNKNLILAGMAVVAVVGIKAFGK